MADLNPKFYGDFLNDKVLAASTFPDQLSGIPC